jgi:hypothetical protein
MGILAGIGNIYFVYQFLKKLVTPFEKTKAFELGIIDEKGTILKRRRDLNTQDEKDAYNLSDTLIWNIKKLMGKIPGGRSRIASYAAALYLIKEESDNPNADPEELELQFFDNFEKIYNEDSEFDTRTLNNLEKILIEDTPTTVAGGIATRGKPLGNPPKGMVMKRFAGKDVFAIDPALYHKSRLGKKRYDRYKKYVGEDEVGEYIRQYARKYPKKPIIVMDSTTGCMQYLKYGK